MTAVAVLFVGCTLFMLEQHRDQWVSEHRSGERLARTIGGDVADAIASGDAVKAKRDLDLLGGLDRIAFGELRGADGQVKLAWRPPAKAADGGVDVYDEAILRDGRTIGRFRLGVRRPPTTRAVGEYLAMGGALFFCATALALFLGRWLAARITTPVARLAAAMESVGQSGGFQVRVEPGAADEIGRLTQCFNVLMARLHVKDTTLRRTLAELVDARDAAEAANFAKSQFLANMSHEIRTPLNGVLAMAQILQRSSLEAVQRDQVEVIHQSGETLLSLLNDILDVSKIEAGKLELEVAPFDVEALVRATVAGFSAVAARKQLRLKVEIGAGAGGVREGDAARLRQILNNFLSNALKFTSAGEVRLSLTTEAIEGVEGLRLTVRDTGIGISPDKLPLLFQKFTQLDASTTRRFGGTGLGLAICRELAELMGGRVWVESQTGIGSAFSALLPLRRIADAAPQPQIPTVAAGADDARAVAASDGVVQAPPPPEPVGESDERPPLRVLAAEDNPTNQLVLTTIMQVFGLDLTLASDGIEAVEAWRSGHFDVVLMDIQMPRLDGVSATRRIRSEESASGRSRTPILALSANALTHQVESYLAAGMDGHIAKPIELAKLQAALEKVFEGPSEAVAAA